MDMVGSQGRSGRRRAIRTRRRLVADGASAVIGRRFCVPRLGHASPRTRSAQCRSHRSKQYACQAVSSSSTFPVDQPRLREPAVGGAQQEDDVSEADQLHAWLHRRLIPLPHKSSVPRLRGRSSRRLPVVQGPTQVPRESSSSATPQGTSMNHHVLSHSEEKVFGCGDCCFGTNNNYSVELP